MDDGFSSLLLDLPSVTGYAELFANDSKFGNHITKIISTRKILKTCSRTLPHFAAEGYTECEERECTYRGNFGKKK